MGTTPIYKARHWNLAGLKGISNKTLEMHFKLYEGYVSETNRLTEHLAGMLRDGQVDQEEMPAYSELTRRLGFARRPRRTRQRCTSLKCPSGPGRHRMQQSARRARWDGLRLLPR
jgi:hypothetical protein